ncbi:hypothetical protein T09_13119 [Trichinella sp. T9]|nr:hypothetical protein T09_13119 [Trichinella sp. T9]
MSEDQKLNNVMKQQLLLLLSSELSFKNQTSKVTQKKSGRSVLTVHDLFEIYFPCKSTDNITPDITEVETEEQRPVSG